jgi:hypothetical protein
MQIDPHEITGFLVDIYEDLKSQNQRIAVLSSRLDCLCETLAHLHPDFRERHDDIARMLSARAPLGPSPEDDSYSEIIQRLKAGEHLRP